MHPGKTSLPLSPEDAEAFVRKYAFHRIGLVVESRWPVSAYTYAMWDNVRNRIVLESRRGKASDLVVLQELGPVDYSDEAPGATGRTLVFINQRGAVLELLFDEANHSVTVLMNGAVRMAFPLENGVDDNIHHDQGWHFSNVILGGAASGRDLLSAGVGYECPGIMLPLVVYGTARSDVLKFVLPDQREFYFDGEPLTAEFPAAQDAR